MCDLWSSLLMKAAFDTTPSTFIDVIFMDVLLSLRSGLLPCLLVQFPCAGSGIIICSFSRLVYSSDVASMSTADGRSMSIFTGVVLRWDFSWVFVSLAKDFMGWLLSSCLSLSSDCICSRTMLDAPRTIKGWWNPPS